MDATTTNEAPETKLHFLDYWRVIRLRRSLILVVFLLCVMTSTLLTIWLPKVYASMVQIEVQKDDPEVPVKGSVPSISAPTRSSCPLSSRSSSPVAFLPTSSSTCIWMRNWPSKTAPATWTFDDTFDALVHGSVSVDADAHDQFD